MKLFDQKIMNKLGSELEGVIYKELGSLAASFYLKKQWKEMTVEEYFKSQGKNTSEEQRKEMEKTRNHRENSTSKPGPTR